MPQVVHIYALLYLTWSIVPLFHPIRTKPNQTPHYPGAPQVVAPSALLYAYLLLFAIPQIVSRAPFIRGLSIFKAVRKRPKLQVNNLVFFQVGNASACHH